MTKTFELDEENIFLIKNAIEGEMRVYRNLLNHDAKTQKGVPELIAKYQKLLDIFSNR